MNYAIKLDNPVQANELVSFLTTMNGINFDITYGRYNVDGKSILGVLYLASFGILNLNAITDDPIVIDYIKHNLELMNLLIEEKGE